MSAVVSESVATLGLLTALPARSERFTSRFTMSSEKTVLWPESALAVPLMAKQNNAMYPTACERMWLLTLPFIESPFLIDPVPPRSIWQRTGHCATHPWSGGRPRRDTGRAMTDEEMIAVLRRLADAFNSRDFDAVAELVHPDTELVRTGGMSSVVGIAALREWMGRTRSRNNTLSRSTSGSMATRSSYAYTRRAEGPGAASHWISSSPTSLRWTIRGLVRKAQGFLPHEEADALEAAGLLE